MEQSQNTTPMAEIVYREGLPRQLLPDAARLYDQAFGAKLGVAVPDRRRRVALVRAGLQPEFGLAAVSGQRLVGLAGVHSRDGSLTGGITMRLMLAHLGLLGCARAAAVLQLYDREPAPDELVMDGVAVDATCRSQGVGGRLLDEVAGYARARGLGRVRLDVIDSNPRARRLYERKGFVEVRHESYPLLGRLLGFSGASTMELRIGAADRRG